MNIEQLIADLKAQGLETEQIVSSLEQMVAEEKITLEDFEKAKHILLGVDNPTTPEDEKALAEKQFGLKFI